MLDSSFNSLTRDRHLKIPDNSNFKTCQKFLDIYPKSRGSISRPKFERDLNFKEPLYACGSSVSDDDGKRLQRGKNISVMIVMGFPIACRLRLIKKIVCR